MPPTAIITSKEAKREAVKCLKGLKAPKGVTIHNVYFTLGGLFETALSSGEVNPAYLSKFKGKGTHFSRDCWGYTNY